MPPKKRASPKRRVRSRSPNKSVPDALSLVTTQQEQNNLDAPLHPEVTPYPTNSPEVTQTQQMPPISDNVGGADKTPPAPPADGTGAVASTNASTTSSAGTGSPSSAADGSVDSAGDCSAGVARSSSSGSDEFALFGEGSSASTSASFRKAREEDPPGISQIPPGFDATNVNAFGSAADGGGGGPVPSGDGGQLQPTAYGQLVHGSGDGLEGLIDHVVRASDSVRAKSSPRTKKRVVKKKVLRRTSGQTGGETALGGLYGGLSPSSPPGAEDAATSPDTSAFSPGFGGGGPSEDEGLAHSPEREKLLQQNAIDTLNLQQRAAKQRFGLPRSPASLQGSGPDEYGSTIGAGYSGPARESDADGAKKVISSPIEWLNGLQTLYGGEFLVMLFVAQHILKGFAGSFVGQPERFLYREYHVAGPRMQVFQGVSSLPWALKPIVGLLSDLVPIGG